MSPWESLVREHLPVVTGVALRVLGDRAAAEDVAQDVFLHLLQNPHALDNASNVRSFLCRSAINRALDRIRERDRRERREAAFEVAPRDLNPLDAAWHEEIRRSVEALPEPERDAVAARYFRGLTVREAAREMRVSVGTVCNRLEAGVKRLRKWLGAAAFGVVFAVRDDDAFAAEPGRSVERLLRRNRQSGDGSSETGVNGRRRRTGKTMAAAGLAGVAAWLISLWVGRPGEILDSSRRPVEIASYGSDAGTVAPAGPQTTDTSRESASGQPASGRPRGEVFRAEGFLVREGDGYVLLEPEIRDPKRVEGPGGEGLARKSALNEPGDRTIAAKRSEEFRSRFRDGVEFYRIGHAEASCARFAEALDRGVDRRDILFMRDEMNWKVLESMLLEGGELRATALRIFKCARDVRVSNAGGSAPETTNGRPLFRLEPNDLLNSIPAGKTNSFASWLDGLVDPSSLPRVRLVLQAEWIDKERGIAMAVEVEESEVLGEEWLAAWREALRANASLARAFDLPPGAQRRADALVAADRLEASLSAARASRRGDAAASWRIRRESEIEIASASAVSCLGREETFPEGPVESAGPEALAAARAMGLELEPVPAIRRCELALHGGARILSVVPGSAAERAGLRPGDVIWRATPLAGFGRSAPRQVLRPEDVSALLAEVAENGGSGLEFEVVRGMEALALSIDL